MLFTQFVIVVACRYVARSWTEIKRELHNKGGKGEEKRARRKRSINP